MDTKTQQRENDRCTIHGYELLRQLSDNLHWSWNHSTDILWEKLDPALWALTHNPREVLQVASREKLEKLLADPHYHAIAQDLVEINRLAETQPSWFSETHKNSPLKCVAYFSMEYMLTEALPIYSGGLGNVAGDQLKAASDLGLPVVAVGLLYQQGYFRQIFDSNGAQQALHPYNEPSQMPITPLRKPDGEWLRLEIVLPGYSLWLRTWQVNVGRVKLLLLDTNDPANFPAHRAITSELYGGDAELRLKQEITLGIGGWRLLEALNLAPSVCHLNEGHAAFAVLERAYNFMKSHTVDFETALRITRAGNLFTTHTAVEAGFDRFSPDLIKKYLSFYSQNHLKISLKSLLGLGRINPNDDNEPFNMAFLAMHGSAFANGVSALHEKVSRQLFSPLFPRWPEDEIPIGHVTNGVHMPSWDSAGADDLWTKTCGKERWLADTKCLEKKIKELPDAPIWEMRTKARRELVDFTRWSLPTQLALSGDSEEEREKAKNIFDPNILTLGFARRFATYKRPNLLLHDPERFIAILTNSKRPVQLLLAGKAHPADIPGQALIHQWSSFIRDPRVSPHVVFLSDYNMHLCKELVQGVDVWINTPLRPWEACGTSGMKVLVNGGLNLSVPDGWWAEAYSPKVGWAIGQSHDGEHIDANARDAEDAKALYTLLENEVIPLFYERNDQDIPVEWINRIRTSMAELTPYFSSNRSVREYTEKYYLPAAKLYHNRINGNILKEFNTINENWNSLHFGQVNVQTFKDVYRFNIEIFLDKINPSDLTVELYVKGDSMPSIYVMKEEGKSKNPSKMHIYSAEVPADYPINYYTPRIVPKTSELTQLELPFIHWQR